MKPIIFIPTLGLMLPEFTDWLDKASDRLGFLFDFVASPFIAISRQTIVKKAAAKQQKRVIMIDDDVILPDAAIIALMSSSSIMEVLTYPAKHDDRLIVAGDIYSPKHPDESFPSQKLWKQLTELQDVPELGYKYCNAHWAGLGAFSLDMKWAFLAPNFNIIQEYNPWISNTMFMGEDVTFFTKLRSLGPSRFWDEYYSSLVDRFAMGEYDRKICVKIYEGTKHLPRMRSL